MDVIISILHATLRTSTPIALAALGGLFSQRSGVLNIALEGMMLIGAFASVVTSYATGSVVVAIIVAIIAAMILGLIFSFFGVSCKGNFIITGLAINILSMGLSSFLLQTLFGTRGTFADPKIVGIDKISIPFLDKVPIIGPILNNQTPLVYVAILMIFIVSIILYKTKLGLYIRVVGEKEEAAESTGISIIKYKYISVLLGAGLCALAGVHLGLETVKQFGETMTADRGFIALAAIFCGSGTPIGTYVFSFLFGFAEAIQMRLQTFNIPGEFVQMIPFIFIIVILTIVAIYKKRGRTTRGVKEDG